MRPKMPLIWFQHLKHVLVAHRWTYVSENVPSFFSRPRSNNEISLLFIKSVAIRLHNTKSRLTQNDKQKKNWKSVCCCRKPFCDQETTKGAIHLNPAATPSIAFVQDLWQKPSCHCCKSFEYSTGPLFPNEPGAQETSRNNASNSLRRSFGTILLSTSHPPHCLSWSCAKWRWQNGA